MSTSADVSNATRVRVQIGVSRLQQPPASTIKPADHSINASSNDIIRASSDTALVNFCNSAFLRSKRKLNPENSKVLTIDSDTKLKRSASAVDNTQQLAAPEPTTVGPRVEIINGQIVIKESSLVSSVDGLSTICKSHVRTRNRCRWWPTLNHK
jgi:hypothetical protein